LLGNRIRQKSYNTPIAPTIPSDNTQPYHEANNLFRRYFVAPCYFLKGPKPAESFDTEGTQPDTLEPTDHLIYETRIEKF
jgi:hypothetical protein